MFTVMTRIVSAMVLIVVLATTGGLVGCGDNGDQEGGEKEIIIGMLTDFTGPACYAVRPTMDGYMDAFRWFAETDPIPGVKVKFITYDQKTDPGRVPPGYMWLKGQGAIMMYIISPTDRSILADRFAEDQILCQGASVDEGSPAHPWSFVQYGSNGFEAEAGMQWIIDTWDYAGTGRSPKVGHFSWAHASGDFHQWGLDRTLERYPGKLDWQGRQTALVSASTFAGEVSALKDCDYIWMTPAGTMPGSFMKEARARGYTGAFIGGTNAFSGYFPLIRTIVPADQLYECYQMQWWPWYNEDYPFIDMVKEILQKYRADSYEEAMEGSGPIGGLCMAIPAYDSIKRAVEAVGAENVDGAAIRDAFLSFNVTLEGFGNTWQFGEDFHVLMRSMKAYKWDLDRTEFVNLGGDWVTPDSLAG